MKKNLFGKKKKDYEDMISENDNLENVKEPKIRTEEEKANYLFYSILLGATALGVLSGGLTVLNSIKYNPSDFISVDLSPVSNFKSFAESINLGMYEDMILKHNNETQNNELDIKRVSSNIGREYPFTAILNKYNNNDSTKLCKFIYTELKPAIISYKLANGGALPTDDDLSDENRFYTVDLSSLDALLNIRDASLSSFEYKVKDATDNSNIEIKVFDGADEVPVKIFDITQFTIKNLATNQVSLNYNNENLILQVKEEYNNVRLDKIVFTENEKYITLVDTLTNKKVKIIKA